MEHRLGSSHIVQVTASNRGGAPIGVSSLGLSLSDGRYIPMIEHLPAQGSRELPAVLATGEYSTGWLDYSGLVERLAADGVELRAIMAHLTDGSTRSRAVPRHWRRPGQAWKGRRPP